MTLHKAIDNALKRKIEGELLNENVSLRIAPVPNSPDYNRFVNNYFVFDNVIFGDLCLFSPGQMQALIQISVDPTHPTLEEVMKALEIAESKAPDGHEYLNGISYWMVIDDHFYQIQHVSIQSKAMEEYFTWLLRDKTNIIGQNEYVELQAEFDREQIGGDLGDISSIEIGGLIPETTLPSGTSIAPQDSDGIVEFETRESLGEKIAASWAKARKIIEDIFGEVETEKLIASMPADAALDVRVNIGYRATKRKFNKEFMGNLAAGLRNAPDGELRVRGKNGEIKGDDARLSTDMTIRKMSSTSSLLELDHALEQMLEVHRRFLHDGKIVD